MSNNKKRFKINIYGKEGCQKCTALKSRIESMLKKNQKFNDFEMAYYDVKTIEGLIAYANAETVNGQRIPSLQILEMDSESNQYVKIRDPRKEERKEGKLFVPTYLQLETDYSDPKKAVIKPKEIENLMLLAMGE